MKKYTSLLVAGVALVFVCVGFAGCAHGPNLNQQLDEKLAKEPQIRSRAEYKSQAGNLIRTAPGLSDDQRSKLLEMLAQVGAQSDQLHEQSLKLRAVLIKNMIATNADPVEVDRLKERIKKVEQERISLFFRTVHGVNTIMGRWGSRTERENQEFFDQMMLETMDLNYM